MKSENTNMIGLQKVESVRVFEQATEQIRELIQNGSLTPGQKLPSEAELSKELSVSRSSVRESIRVLEAEGLVEVKRGSGTYISDTQTFNKAANEFVKWILQREESLEQVLQIREKIESLTASLTAERASQMTLDNLRAIIQEQSRIINTEKNNDQEMINKLSQLDSDFHIEIAKACGNDIAIEIVTHVIPAFKQSNKVVLYLLKHMKQMLEEHLAIMDALEKKDSILAGEAMSKHILRVKAEIMNIK